MCITTSGSTASPPATTACTWRRPHDWSIRKRTLRGGLRDGIDLIEVHNGALSYSVLPTRGMGLWRGDYRGTAPRLEGAAPRAGPSQVRQRLRPRRPRLAGRLRRMAVPLRPGLQRPARRGRLHRRQGRARRDPLDLHGRIANQPAHYVEVRVSLDPPYELSVIGQVEEGGLFFPHLRLTTTYTTVPGSNRLVIHDVVENRGAQPAEMQLLYHCNLGPPFLEAGSRVVAPIREVAPISARAAEGIDTLETYAGPDAGFAEQVYCYDLLARRRRPDAGDALQPRAPTRPWSCASTARSCPASRCGRTPWPWRTATSPAWSRRRTTRTSRRFERQQGRVAAAARRRPLGEHAGASRCTTGRRRGGRPEGDRQPASAGQGDRAPGPERQVFASVTAVYVSQQVPCLPFFVPRPVERICATNAPLSPSHYTP